MNEMMTVCEVLPAGSYQFVDVRSMREFATGHIAGSIHVPLDEVESRLDDLSSGEPVVIVCQSGLRAGIAAKAVTQVRPEARILQGGINAWKLAGRPLVMSAKTHWSLERQVRLGAGLLVLAGVIATLLISPKWMFLSGFVGMGLTFAGLTDFCPMGILLSKMPWNGMRRAARPIVSSVTDGKSCALPK